MYNIVRSRELRAAGLNSRAIGDAVGCCLMKLTYGMYSIVTRCCNPKHRRIASLITDDDWLEQVQGHRSRVSGHRSRVPGHSANANGLDYDYLNLIEKLKIASYPRYHDDDVICGVSAAYIHNLPMYGVEQTLIHVSNPSSRAKTSIVSRRTKAVPAEDIVAVGKLVLTSPVRTSLDLISEIGEVGAFVAMEEVVRRLVFGSAEAASGIGRIGYPHDIHDMADEAVRGQFRPALDRLRKGQKRAARLIEWVGALSESYAESRCSYNLKMLGITCFEQQVKILDKGRLLARVDFMDRQSNTILFVDGTAKYADNGNPLLQKEALQHNRLVGLGYRIVRFTFAEVLNLEDFATKLYSQAPWLRGSASRNRAV